MSSSSYKKRTFPSLVEYGYSTTGRHGTDDVVARGRALYAETCTFCHGFAAESSGVYPDLRQASAEVHEQWDTIVRGGSRTAGGMPSFADRLSADDARAIQAYVLERAWHEPGAVERALGWFAENACIPASWMTD